MKRVHQVDAGNAVDRRVMNFRQQRVAALRRALDIVEPFNDQNFPGRARQIERARKGARRQNAELAPVAGFRQGGVANVIFKIEIRIFDPVRIIDAERHLDHALAHDRREVKPSLDELQNILEADKTAGRRGRIINDRRRDMQRRIGLLKGDESGVQPLHLFHRCALP